MTRDEVYEICKRVAPKFGFDPILVLAMCEQESSYNHTEVRLENGFYRKYVRPQNLASTVSVCLSASYGLMQVMGLSLEELGYFNQSFSAHKDYLNIIRGIDCLMVDADLQVEWGCRTLLRKLKGTTGLQQALLRYNGSAEYPPKIMARYERLKKELA